MRMWLLLVAILLPLPLHAQKPNFVIMMCDDQRFDGLSCGGNTIVKTPHIDRIAKEGVMMKNAFVTYSLCAPSRGTLLSGMYPHQHGVVDNFDRKLKADVKILPEYLAEAGYEVAFCGKSHHQNALRDRKWDYYFGYKGQGNYLKPVIAEGTNSKDVLHDGYMDDVVTDKAIAWMKQPRTKPYCLFLFFKAPHRAWQRPERYKNLFADVNIPLPALWHHKGEGKPRAFLMAANMFGQFPDVHDYQAMMKDYYTTVTAVDDNVGKVFKTLEETKQLDNTLLMHTSDNGFFLGEWQRFDKRFMHEVSIRVPMLIRYPKLIPPGTTKKEMVINNDIAPTVMDVAGLPVPKTMQGRSMKPLFTGEKVDWRKDWFYEYLEYPDTSHNVQKMVGVRTEKYKLIHYYEPPPGYGEEWEMYDLEADPEEKVNLANRPIHKETVTKLKARLMELRKETGFDAAQPR